MIAPFDNCKSLGLAMVLAVAGLAGQAAAQEHLDGSTVFRTYCGSCHGAGAKGDGPLADQLRVHPSDLTQIAKRNDGSFPADEVRQIIDGRKPLPGHGGGDMPIWGEAFKQSSGTQDEATVQSRINSLVEYLRSVQEQ